MKKIAIIGANQSINKLILKAKSLGYETHVFAWKCGDPGENSADYFYPISVDHADAILVKCQEIGIEGVASVTSEFTIGTVNYIARKMGLVGNSEKSGIYARNKYSMRCAFKAAGLYTPWFIKAGTPCHIEASKFCFPVIVKPVDSWNGKGVMRVDEPSGIAAAVEYAKSKSLTNEAIIEGFMEGPEYSCECICYHGEYHALQITKKLTSGYPRYVEIGHVQPCDLEEHIQEKVKQSIFTALAALDVTNGAAHAEFRILPDGNIGIIEIGARMGGGCIGTDLVMLSTGYDYLKMVIDVACGNTPDFTVHSHYSMAKVKFIINQDDVALYRKLRDSGKIIYEEDICEDFEGDVIDGSQRHGCYITVE